METGTKRSYKATKAPGLRRGQAYSFGLRLRVVKLCLEEGFPVQVVSRETGVGKASVARWVKLYREQGQAGLARPERSRHGTRKLPGPVRRKIIETKTRLPQSGSKGISQLLRRMFFLPASPRTVQRVLHEESLVAPSPRQRPRRNIRKPRSFERSTPNQMWQSDIFPFKLGGEAVRPPEWLGPGGYAYRIGLIFHYRQPFRAEITVKSNHARKTSGPIMFHYHVA